MWIGEKLFPKKKEKEELKFINMDSLCLCFPEYYEIFKIIKEDKKIDNKRKVK